MVRLAKGNDFRLSLGDFTLRFNDGGNTPKIEFALDNPTRTRGVLTAGEGELTITTPGGTATHVVTFGE